MKGDLASNNGVQDTEKNLGARQRGLTRLSNALALSYFASKLWILAETCQCELQIACDLWLSFKDVLTQD